MIPRTILLLLTVHFLAASASASALLNEVFYDADGPDAPWVFTEIRATPGLALDGWSLVGVNGSTGADYRSIDLSGVTIPGDGLLVVATSTAGPSLAAVRDFIANVDWQNGPDGVQLRNSLGAVVDALQYGDAGAGNAGEGLPAADVLAGLSLQRVWGAADTDDNANDFLAAAPTPGLVPTSATTPIPAPPTWSLVPIGLIAAIRPRRRRERATGRSYSGSPVSASS